jgi:hypothetical protein
VADLIHWHNGVRHQQQEGERGGVADGISRLVSLKTASESSKLSLHGPGTDSQNHLYASVEQRDNPTLRDKPVAVGYAAKRGVVLTASYEARRFGVRSAMPSTAAMRKCAELMFVPPRLEVYRAVSQQVYAIFRAYTPLVEPLSFDEAYLDVTENLKGVPTAWVVAKDIRARIYKETSPSSFPLLRCGG